MCSSLCVQLHFYCYCFSKGKILDFAQLTIIWLMPKTSCYLLSIYLNLFIWQLEIPLCYLSDALLILFTSRDLTRLKTEFSERCNISDKIDLRIINNLTWTHLFIDMRLYIRQWNFKFQTKYLTYCISVNFGDGEKLATTEITWSRQKFLLLWMPSPLR